MHGTLKRILRSMLASASLFALSLGCANADELDEAVSFEIPAQPIQNALLELSRQAAFQICSRPAHCPVEMRRVSLVG